MVLALQKDKAKVVEILTASFVNNKSVNYLIPQDGLKLFCVHKVMDYSFEVYTLFGEVFISEDNKACALLLYSDLNTASLK